MLSRTNRWTQIDSHYPPPPLRMSLFRHSHLSVSRQGRLAIGLWFEVRTIQLLGSSLPNIWQLSLYRVTILALHRFLPGYMREFEYESEQKVVSNQHGHPKYLDSCVERAAMWNSHTWW